MFSRILLGFLCVMLALGIFALFAAPETTALLGLLGSTAVVGMALLQGDKTFVATKALPNGAASTTSDGFDLELGARSDFLANCELLITAPVLGATPLPDAKTMKFIVEHDDAVGFGTVATLLPDVIIQTGAGGVGAAAATKRVRLPLGVKRYVRVKATGSASGDASGSSFTVELKF